MSMESSIQDPNLERLESERQEKKDHHESAIFKRGWVVLGWLILLLILLGAEYTYLHLKWKSDEQIDPANLVEITRYLRMVDVEARKSKPAYDTLSKLLSDLTNSLNEAGYYNKEIASSAGRVQGDISARMIIPESIETLTAVIEKEIVSSKSSFFWTSSPLKWLEVIFFSWFGVLVNIIFRVSQTLWGESSKKEEIRSYLGWIVYAPAIALIFMFVMSFRIGIFTQDKLIFGIDISRGPVEIILVISFILGFFSRWILEMVELIKDRFIEVASRKPGSR